MCWYRFILQLHVCYLFAPFRVNGKKYLVCEAVSAVCGIDLSLKWIEYTGISVLQKPKHFYRSLLSPIL